MKTLAALPLLALAGCSVCQPTRFAWPVFDDPIAALIMADDGGQSSTPASPATEPAASGDTPSAPVAEQPSALAVGALPSGEYHAMLIVSTKRGDFVLDNLTNELRPLGRQPATIIAVQSARDPRLWQRVRH